jgi:hypothetical protein
MEENVKGHGKALDEKEPANDAPEIDHEGEDGYGSCCDDEKGVVDKEEILSNPG